MTANVLFVLHATVYGRNRIVYEQLTIPRSWYIKNAKHFKMTAAYLFNPDYKIQVNAYYTKITQL